MTAAKIWREALSSPALEVTPTRVFTSPMGCDVKTVSWPSAGPLAFDPFGSFTVHMELQ